MSNNALGFENLKSFNLIEDAYIIDENNKDDSIVLIRSKKNNRFGTGFVIDQDNRGSFILTCTHVIEEVGIDNIVIGESDAEVIVLGSSDNIDLAVIYTIKKFEVSFKLISSLCRNSNLKFRGSSRFTSNKFMIKTQEATLIQENLNIPEKKNKLEYYQLEAKKNSSFQKGMDGAPIFCEESGKVIAVLSLRDSDGKKGYAIPIKNLLTVWKDMPKILRNEEDILR